MSTKRLNASVVFGLAVVSLIGCQGCAATQASAPPVGNSGVTAIDILLQPDATMLAHCQANNERLLKVYPKGFSLDATHTPHITLLQCFVRTADLDKLYSAEGRVFAAAHVTRMKLEAFKYYYARTGDHQAASGRHRGRKAVHGGSGSD
jgi:hypothetical protein